MATTTTYHGSRRGGRLFVFINQGLSAEQLVHHVLHSPDGFECGYYGSGPLELARSMLWDFLGTEPSKQAYQAFTDQVISKLSKNQDWSLTVDDISEWLFTFHGGKILSVSKTK